MRSPELVKGSDDWELTEEELLQLYDAVDDWIASLMGPERLVLSGAEGGTDGADVGGSALQGEDRGERNHD